MTSRTSPPAGSDNALSKPDSSGRRGSDQAMVSDRNGKSSENHAAEHMREQGAGRTGEHVPERDKSLDA